MTDAQGEREEFEATADHPWLVLTSDGEKRWVETAALALGDRLLAGDGETLALDAKPLQPTLVATYNLTVADHHTFLVGEDGVVVHNCKWVRDARNLIEQLVLRSAQSGEGKLIIQNLGDSRFKGMEKWEHIHRWGDGTRTTTVHYVRDPKTGALMDFKLMTKPKP